MKRIIVLLFGLLIGNAGFAFGLGDALSIATGSSGGASATQIIEQYVASSKQVLSSYGTLLDAVKDKDGAAKIQAHSKNLTSSMTSNQIDESSVIISESNKKFKDELSKVTLDADSQKKFNSGAVSLGIGALSYLKVALQVKGYRPSPNDISIAGPALEVAKNIPGDMVNLKNSVLSVTDYYKTRNLPLPKELEDATSALSKF
jgi:hypothetical protein